jgi:hypothetical protein
MKRRVLALESMLATSFRSSITQSTLGRQAVWSLRANPARESGIRLFPGDASSQGGRCLPLTPAAAELEIYSGAGLVK